MPASTSLRRLLVVPVAVVLLAGAALIYTTGTSAQAGPTNPTNPTAAENERRGDGIWRMMSSVAAPESAIEGYASKISVEPGRRLGFHVSTAPAARYRIEIRRLGWYEGAGARLVDCLPGCGTDKVGITQPGPGSHDPDTGYLAAHWARTDTLRVPASWVSGTYVAEFVLTSGPNAGRSTFYPFIVKEPAELPASDRADILVQMPVSTWQAYNHWGGKSTYGFNSRGGDADVVSFDRPLHVPLRPHQDPDHGGPLDPGGPMAIFYWEYATIRFLEREGYNVAYTTGPDVDADPELLQRYDMVMSIGHDEYWSMGQRKAFEDARDAGVDLAFIASNTAYWQVRYTDGGRTMVAYKESASNDPVQGQRETTRFRDLDDPQPECELMGVQYDPPIVASDGNHHPGYTVTAGGAAHPWAAGSGMTAGEQLHNLVGYELDHIVPGCDVPGELTTLFNFDGDSPYLAPGGDGAQAVVYTAPSGAKVFSSGSMNLSWGLDGNNAPWSGSAVEPMPGLQKFTRNMVADMTTGGPAGTAARD